MFHVDNNTGVPVMPAVSPLYSALRLFFTEGGNGIPPTYPGPDWFNTVQSELLNILDQAGIDPDKADATQLLTAFTRLFLSRENPFADIKADGPAAVAQGLANLGLGDSEGYVGRLVKTTTFSSSGALTLNTLTKRVKIRMWGAGSSGSGSATSGSGAVSGGAGAYIEVVCDVSSITSLTVVVGAGGSAIAAGSSTSGITGGNTTITELGLVAGGGAVGSGGTPSETMSSLVISPTLSVSGQAGQGASGNLGGIGGSVFGTYGGLPHTSRAGDSGGFPGGGGAGASYPTGTPLASGAGANGYVIIEEFA